MESFFIKTTEKIKWKQQFLAKFEHISINKIHESQKLVR